MTQECARASAFVNEDHGDYCNAWEEMNSLTQDLPSCARSEFKYTTAAELDSLLYTAKLDMYGGGGYVYRLNGLGTDISSELVELQQQHWVNNHTRAIFLEFSVYNPGINLFGICTIVAEFLPGGGIKPYWRIEPVRLLHHHEASGSFILMCEVIFCIYIIYFIFDEIGNMKRLGKAYWKTYWILADLGLIILAFIAIGLYIYRSILTNEILDTFVKTYGNGYVKLQYVGLFDEFYGYAIGSILFVGTIKFIKMLRFNNRFAILTLTLKLVFEDLSGFLAVFFLVFFAFVQVFYMILHIYMLEFHTVIASLETCFTMLLNKFKFGGIRDNSMTAAVMFFCFAISCSFILINVLITIIIEAYEKVKGELEQRGNKYEILDFVSSQVKAVIGIGQLPPTLSALREDVNKRNRGDAETEETEKMLEDDDQNVVEMESKVTEFLQFIDKQYFDGQMDFSSKEALKGQMAQNATEKGLPGGNKPSVAARRIFASD